jgi:hypothetical protein
LDTHTIVAPVRVEKNPKSDPVGQTEAAPSASVATGSYSISDLTLARNPCGVSLCTLHVPEISQSSQLLAPSHSSSALVSSSSMISPVTCKDTPPPSANNRENNQPSGAKRNGRGFGDTSGSSSSRGGESNGYGDKGKRMKKTRQSQASFSHLPRRQKQHMLQKMQSEASTAIQKAIEMYD